MANAPKPLMIRGDRLLLALDVLAFYYDRRRVGRSLRRKCINAKLCALYNLGPNGGIALDRLYGEYALIGGEGLREFLTLNASHIATVTLEVPVHYGTCRLSTINQFLRGIASGELTEEDFKE